MTDSVMRSNLPDLSGLNRSIVPEAPAISAYNRIEKMIAKFEANLDADHEVGLCIVGAPGGGTVHITGLGYWGPDLIRFFGAMPDGSPIEIIQNVSQINVMLTAVRKMGDEAIRIGADEEGGEE